MNGPDFRGALGEADRALEKWGMPPEVDRRLRDRIAGRGAVGKAAAVKPSGHARQAWALGLSGVCAVAAAVVFLVGKPAAPPSFAPPVTAGGLAIQDPSRDFAVGMVDGAIEILTGSGVLVDEATGSALATEAHARLRKESDGVRVLRGRVVVAVRKRMAGAAPARVLVSHGIIEVMGTRFTVEQAASGGKVTLHEGAIRFVASDGKVTMLAPGDSLAWPLVVTVSVSAPVAEVVVAAQAAVPASPSAAPRRLTGRTPVPEAAAEPLDEFLQRIAVMRSRARYEDAAAGLVAALRASAYPVVAQERLSYELGSLLTHQLRDSGRACAHWQMHVQKFLRGRYDREVQQAEQTLGCRSKE